MLTSLLDEVVGVLRVSGLGRAQDGVAGFTVALAPGLPERVFVGHYDPAYSAAQHAGRYAAALGYYQVILADAGYLVQAIPAAPRLVVTRPPLCPTGYLDTTPSLFTLDTAPAYPEDGLPDFALAYQAGPYPETPGAFLHSWEGTHLSIIAPSGAVDTVGAFDV